MQNSECGNECSPESTHLCVLRSLQHLPWRDHVRIRPRDARHAVERDVQCGPGWTSASVGNGGRLEGTELTGGTEKHFHTTLRSSVSPVNPFPPSPPFPLYILHSALMLQPR